MLADFFLNLGEGMLLIGIIALAILLLKKAWQLFLWIAAIILLILSAICPPLKRFLGRQEKKFNAGGRG